MIYKTFLLEGTHENLMWQDWRSTKDLDGRTLINQSHAIGINQLTTDPLMLTDPSLSPVVFPDDTLKKSENTNF